jgi:hypothetical protein
LGLGAGFLQKKLALVRAGVLLCLLGFLRVVLEKVCVCGWFFVVNMWWRCGKRGALSVTFRGPKNRTGF